jgi:hypothetical protein
MKGLDGVADGCEAVPQAGVADAGDNPPVWKVKELRISPR